MVDSIPGRTMRQHLAGESVGQFQAQTRCLRVVRCPEVWQEDFVLTHIARDSNAEPTFICKKEVVTNINFRSDSPDVSQPTKFVCDCGPAKDAIMKGDSPIVAKGSAGNLKGQGCSEIQSSFPAEGKPRCEPRGK